MTDYDCDEGKVNQFLVYAAYGEVMHQFQVLEVVLWGFNVRSIKNGTTLDQAVQKVKNWDAATLGRLVGGLKNQSHWPPGVLEELDDAKETRDYLAHHFLREYALIKPSEEVKEEAAQQLANVSVRLASLIERLEDHQAALGIPSAEDFDEETRAEIEQLRPTQWFSES